MPTTLPRRLLIHEVPVRTWLSRLSAEAGLPRGQWLSLAEVPEGELERFARLGADHLWLMGVWPSGPRGIQIARGHSGLLAEYRAALPDVTPADVGGSPYAVAGTAADPRLGGPAALARLRERLARRGIGLILDFVPNHTGVDHPWVRAQPDLYVQGTAADLAAAPGGFFAVETALGPRVIAHGKDPNFPAWTDTAQLNVLHPATRAALAGWLLEVARQCDGVRCDMAMLLLDGVFRRTWGERALAGLPAASPAAPDAPAAGRATPDEPWSELIGAVRRDHPRFLLVAEAYWGLEGRLRALGFDLVYDKAFTERLVHGSAAEVRAHLRDRPDQGGTLRFLENHDEPRAAAVLPWPRHRAAAVLAAATPGAVLLHEGQTDGATVRVPVQLLRGPREPVRPEVREHYRRLLSALAEPVLRQGHWRLLPVVPAWDGNPTWQSFVACEWRLEDELRLAVVSFAPVQGQCYVVLGEERLAGRQVALRDRLGEAVYERDGGELLTRGLYLDLPPWGCHLFEVR